MGMPTEEELEEALREAAQMREQGEDPHYVAKSLLNLHYQVEQLERVLTAAELYLHSGMAITEHQRLKKAIEDARRAIRRSAGEDAESFGLE